MFRRSVPFSFLLLMASLAPATLAQAADVTTATLDVTIARSSLVADQIAVEFRVKGTGLNDGTLTQPLPGAMPVALQKDGADLVLDDTFRNEAELKALLPDGDYQLRVNGGVVQATLAYMRPPVPSPAIAKPRAGGVVPPGSIELQFAACPVCNLLGDSVEAELEDGQRATLDQEALSSTSTSWIPQAGSGALALPEHSSFVARVTHATLRQANASATDSDGSLVFSNRFVQSDEIGFKTGFARPVGHVCLAANYPTPPPGCAILAAPALRVLDPSGVFSARVAGHDLEYTVDAASNGALTGSATADLDDNGSQETSSSAFKGKLSGTGGEVRSKLGFVLKNAGLPAILGVKRSETLSIAGDSLAGTQGAAGSIGTTKIKEVVPLSGPLPFSPLGWLLEFDIDSQKPVRNALLTLAGGRSFSLVGDDKFGLAAGQSSFKLSSTDKGIRIGLLKLVLDDAASPLGVTGGSVGASILGQRASAPIP